MKILGIDSSGLVASAAIATEEALLAEYTVNFKKTHSQTLLPMVDEIVKRLELDLEELDAIAIASGPGSFTGLRIGSSTAKGIGFVLRIPIIPVPTLEGLAYNFFGTDRLVCPMMDARRDQVYGAVYEFEQDRLRAVYGQRAEALETVLDEINRLGRSVIFLGDGAAAYRSRIEEKTSVPYSFAPVHLSRQRAGSVAALGLIYLKDGRTETAEEHKPVYLRVSQAERELEERKSV